MGAISIHIAVKVSCGQLAVFERAIQIPFNGWTEKHVAQGFAWRSGSVSFRTLVESGLHDIEIVTTDHCAAVGNESVRVIDVPFEVPANGAIEIGSIADTAPVTLSAGTYRLRCEFLRATKASLERVRLIFANKDEPRFSIVRADDSLSIDGDLLVSARPASS
jgi:hypothetical protein